MATGNRLSLRIGSRGRTNRGQAFLRPFRVIALAALVVALIWSAGQIWGRHERPAFSAVVPLVVEPFAQLAGHIRLRDGALSERASLPAQLARQLKPFDIVLLAAPYKGTSMFIPGRFTHGGVWLGEAGDWRSTELSPQVRARLAQGRGFLHADRQGVRMSGFEELLDGDELVILRLRQPVDAAEVARRVDALLGRDYDFNFDGEDHAELLCTELIEDLFNIDTIATSGFLGREFRTPDQLIDTLVATGAATVMSVGRPDRSDYRMAGFRR